MLGKAWLTTFAKRRPAFSTHSSRIYEAGRVDADDWSRLESFYKALRTSTRRKSRISITPGKPTRQVSIVQLLQRQQLLLLPVALLLRSVLFYPCGSSSGQSCAVSTTVDQVLSYDCIRYVHISTSSTMFACCDVMFRCHPSRVQVLEECAKRGQKRQE